MATVNCWGSNVPVELAKGGTNATSMSTSTGIVKYDGTSLVTSSTAKIDSSNRYTNTAQPAFLAKVSANVANVTGDGTNYHIIYDKVIFDQASNYNNSTGVFTAPITGKYQINAQVNFVNVNPTLIVRGQSQLVATSRTMTNNYMNLSLVSNADNQVSFSYSTLLDMSANDTVYVTMYAQGGSKDVYAGPEMYFSGYLIC